MTSRLYDSTTTTNYRRSHISQAVRSAGEITPINYHHHPQAPAQAQAWEPSAIDEKPISPLPPADFSPPSSYPDNARINSPARPPSAWLDMDTQGVDLSSLGGTPYSQSVRMPFHGDEQFPVVGGAAYDGSYPGNQPPGPQRQDSSASLLYHAQSSSPPWPTDGGVVGSGYPPQPPPYTSYLGPPNDRSRRSRLCAWPPRWHTSWNMYLFFLFGLACAIGHHVYYSVLDGQPANKQIEMLRYGTVLAFAAKAGLGAAVIAAFRQRVWTTVRTRMMSIGAIDSMFAAAEDFIALVNWEFLSGAKIAAALAAFVWLAPLVVILTANTLLVELQTTEHNTSCPGVRTLNFTFEDVNDWRTPLKIDGLFEIPLSLWNTTKKPDQDDDDWFDYYTAPGPNFVQTATIGAYLGQAVGRKNASMESCGTGWNCTFDIDFVAPGYKCQELASGVDSVLKNLSQASGEAKPPFGTDILLPKGSFAYYVFASGGEYSTTQLKDVSPGGIPNMDPPYPKHFGALRTEPVVWVGYAVLANPDETPPTDPEDPKWNSAFIPKLFACEHYETNYTVHLNYTDGTQFATVKRRKFMTPIINTTFVPHVDADDGTADNTTATPEDNYVYPTDIARYRRVAAYHSMGYMLRQFVNGTVEIETSLTNPIANTAALQTKLLDPRNNYFAYPNLMELIQGFYEDLILSVFSNGQFVENVWAAKTDEQAGTLSRGGTSKNHSDYDYPCMRSRTTNVYSYHARDLWIVYGIAVILALLGLIAGTFALYENGGVMRNTRFSSIVAATRGPPLEKLNWEGPGQDRGDVPKDVQRLKIGYGMMGVSTPNLTSYDSRYPGQEPVGGVRCGFGLEGDVNQTRREGSLFHR